MVNKTKTKFQLNAQREVNMKSSTNELLHYYLLSIRQIEGFFSLTTVQYSSE